MLKRCFGVLLVICMLFTMTQPITVAAAETGSLVVGSGTVNEGDTTTIIPITIEKKGSAGIILTQFDVAFPDALILTEKPIVGTLLVDGGSHRDVFTSPYNIGLGDDKTKEDITAEGVLVTLNFKVKEGTPAGTYDITIVESTLENYDHELEPVTLSATNGAITVGGGTSTPTSVTVTFDANGGTGSMPAQTFTVGTAQALNTNAFTREGYTFNGWNTAADGSGTSYADGASYTTAANVTLYAQWTAAAVEQFTVTFDVNGGTPAIDAVKVDKDAKVTEPTTKPTKTGFDFTGWFADANATTKFDFNTPITADTTIYAGWTAAAVEQFTVTFDVAGGTPAIDAVKVDKDAKVTEPTTKPTKTGFDFTGWFADANATTKFDFNTPITADTTIYAGWEEKSNTPAVSEGLVVGNGTVEANDTTTIIPITIEKKGSAGIILTQFDVAFPDALILTEKPIVGTLLVDGGSHRDVFTSPYNIGLGDDKTKEDITAEGVLVTLNFKVKEGTPAGTYDITIVESSLESYDHELAPVTLAVTNGAITVGSGGGGGSTPADVTVTFDGNGGTPATTTATVKQGGTVSKPTTDPTRDGYDFTGWFTDKNGTTAFDFATKIQANTTIYAGWQEKSTTPADVTVTFDGNGGTPATTTATVKQGGTVSKPTTDPTRDGYDFTGWFTDKNGTTAFDFATKIQANTTIYAGWKEKTPADVTVTFDGNGGTPATTTATVKQGETVSKPTTDPTRDGYDFTGWFTDKNGTTAFDFATKIQANTTIYAGWNEKAATPADVTVTFDGNGGTPATTTVTVKQGETVSKPSTDPTRGAYKFLGWFTDQNGLNAFDFTTKIQANTTLYAGWAETGSTGGDSGTSKGGGCYIATSVYGSYDAPEVWTLRRFRDDVLGQTWYGRLFIKAYYAISPTVVRLFGQAEWFQNFWRDKLDTLVQTLQNDGFESTPYQDKDW